MLLTLSVIMPAYNEESLISRAVAEIKQHIFTTIPDTELIIINDGSTDATGVVLEQLSKEDQRIILIMTPHIGHGPALLEVLPRAQGERILLLDSDCQIPLEGFKSIWERAVAVEGLLGARRTRSDPWVRLFITTVLRHTIRFLFHCRLRDANCAFKIFRRVYWSKMQSYIPKDSLTPSIFIAIFLERCEADVIEYPVPYRQRPVGETRLRPWQLLTFCSTAFIQLLKFKRALGAISKTH